MRDGTIPVLNSSIVVHLLEEEVAVNYLLRPSLCKEPNNKFVFCVVIILNDAMVVVASNHLFLVPNVLIIINLVYWLLLLLLFF